MAFDFKKEYKEFYLPKNKPEIVNVPEMFFIAIKGMGNPNDVNGAYKQAIGKLYNVAYTIKMSKMGHHRISGYYDYVVPPLEGFWWQDGIDGIDYSNKSLFQWISVIRVPEFVSNIDFDWAIKQVEQKKKIDCSNVKLITIEEGLCVQCMHIGSYDNEPITVALMNQYLSDNGYENDFCNNRMHHEIYLSDVRKVKVDSLKTVIRHPIKIKQ